MNNMKNLKLLSLCIVSMLVACSDDVDITGIMNPNVATTNVQSTRSLENSSDMLFSVETTKEQLDSFKSIQKYCYSRPYRTNSSIERMDQYFNSNLYAITNLPITIEVKTPGKGYSQKYFTCDGSKREVKLTDNQNINDVKQQFYIVKPAAVTGISNIIYSQKSGTPLVVGGYKGKDYKVLMAKETANLDKSMYYWSFIPSKSYTGYFGIQNQMYFNTSSTSMSDFFYNSLEVNSNNEIRYARYNSKPTQEFRISPIKRFTICDITFDESSAIVTDGTPYTIKSECDYNYADEGTFVTDVKTTVFDQSCFNQYASYIDFKLDDPCCFQIPDVKAKQIVLPHKATGGKASYFNRSNISKTVSFSISGLAPANCYIKIESQLQTYNVSIYYVATAKYENRIIKFAGIWKGVVVANPETNPPTHTAKYYDYKTGNEILPNYAAKFKHSLKTIIK